MNLDLLISKYLDGELTINEDIELRNRLKDSAEDREEFNNAIILNDALRKDAESIELPENLAKATEDIILMKFLANAPIVQQKPFRYNYKKIAFALALITFLFLNIFKIDDLFKENYSSNINIALNQIRDELINEQNDTKPLIRILLPSATKINNAIPTNNNIIPIKHNTDNNIVTSFENNISSNSNTNIEINNKEFIEEPILNQNKIYNNNPYNSTIMLFPSEFYNLNNLNTFENKLQLTPETNTLMITNSTRFNQVNSFNLYNKIESGKVELSSFFGTDLSRNGFNVDNNTTISHFSQSLAYSIDNTNKLGIEFGYTEYSFTDNIMVNVPINGQPNNNINESPEIGHGQEEFISVPFPVKQNKQILWASTFYENSFFNYSDLSLNSRIAIGGSNDGPLTYGRFFAKYELIKGISATLGAEGRLFFAKLPNMNNSNQNIKATFSLIYGFQIIF